MFGAMTSLTGGGGLSSSSSADGDNAFDNGGYTYKSGGSGSGNDGALIVLGVVAVALVFWGRK